MSSEKYYMMSLRRAVAILVFCVISFIAGYWIPPLISISPQTIQVVYVAVFVGIVASLASVIAVFRKTNQQFSESALYVFLAGVISVALGVGINLLQGLLH